MSREMYTIITDPSGKIVVDSADDEGTFFAGRNEETNAMFNFCEKNRFRSWGNLIHRYEERPS